MSLGFLTESALVPSKAKPIRVDSKSLFDLKAVVFQKEQERQQRHREHQDQDQHDSSSGRPAGKYAHLKGRKRAGDQPNERDGRVFKDRNRGVEKRMRRDQDAQEDRLPDQDDERAWHKRSAEALKRKAKLYDAMMAGQRPGGDGESSVLAAECLVDFDAKRERSFEAVDQQELVEITDEFGRSRSVVSGGPEHTAYLQQQRQQEAPAATMETPEPQPSGADVAGKPSSGSFVVSQWEKRLNSDEKTYLQQVHESVTLAKKAGPKQDRQSKKQLRLQKLKAQAAAAATNNAAAFVSKPSSAAAAPGPDEAKAAAQATDFLASLM